MKIYLAARYSRREELCGYRAQLQAMGHEVTSRWLNGKHQIDDKGVPIGDHGEKLIEDAESADRTNPEPDECAAIMRSRFAFEDLQDVLSADCVISWTEPPRSSASRGGRHVEFGIALAQSKRCIVIGYRENIFHWLDDVEFFDTFENTKGTM